MEIENNTLSLHDKIWESFYSRFKQTDVKTFEFTLLEAEKFLSANIAIAESFKTRAATALTFLVPIDLAMIGYLININGKNSTILDHAILAGILAGILLIMIANFFCLKVINVKSSLFPGCSPNNLLCTEWPMSSDIQRKRVLFTQCEEYQKRIEQRISQNDQIAIEFKNAVTLMFYTPIITASFPFYTEIYLLLFR